MNILNAVLFIVLMWMLGQLIAHILLLFWEDEIFGLFDSCAEFISDAFNSVLRPYSPPELQIESRAVEGLPRIARAGFTVEEVAVGLRRLSGKG